MRTGKSEKITIITRKSRIVGEDMDFLKLNSFTSLDDVTNHARQKYWKVWINARVEALKAMSSKMALFCNVTPCSPVGVFRCFGETCCLHLQGQGANQANNHAACSCWLLAFLRLLPCRWKQDIPQSSDKIITRLHGVISQETASNLTKSIHNSVMNKQL
jgi:hypothetical protein